MRRFGGVLLALVLASVKGGGTVDAAKSAEEEAKRAAGLAAHSNRVETPHPRLSANPDIAPGVPMPRETNVPAFAPAVPAAEEAPVAVKPRDRWGLILAVLAVLAGSSLLKRLLSRPGRAG